ncbi:hypothetical protein ABT317_08875, partial [Streptomyces carpinensis]
RVRVGARPLRASSSTRPTERGGRRVRVDGVIPGTAYSLHDLTVFLERVSLECWDELTWPRTPSCSSGGGGLAVWKH